jgi:rhodanese-related sulfurtransferase
MPLQRISAPEAATLQKVGYTVVDVSSPDEYAKGHPAGAYNVPHAFLTSAGDFKANPKFLAVMEGLFAKDVKLLVVCRIGKRSLAAAEALEAAGWVDLKELRPGLKGVMVSGRVEEPGWDTLGLPSEAVTEGRSWAEIKGPDSTPAPAVVEKGAAQATAGVQRVSAPEALTLQKIGYTIVDVSAPEEYGKGHPSGAFNVPHRFLTSSGDFKDNPDFLATMATIAKKDAKVLVVCRIGKRSLAAAEELYAAGYAQVMELRPGLKGVLNAEGRVDEPGWDTLMLPSETKTEGRSWDEIKPKSDTTAAAAKRAVADTGPFQRVAAPEALTLQKIGYTIVDVSAPEEYAKGHPKGAFNVPHRFLTGSGDFKDNPDFVATMATIAKKDAKVLVVCRIGRRSLAAAEELYAAGYTQLKELRPGLKGVLNAEGRVEEPGWDTLLLPSETKTEGRSWDEIKPKSDTTAVAAKRAAVDTGPIQRVSAPEAVTLQKVGYAFIDVSAPEEYAKGHPRGAINVPHAFFTATGGFKPNAKFLPVMQALFPQKDAKLLIVCRIGKRSFAAAEELERAGYTCLKELRPGLKGFVNAQGRVDEPGWDTLGLPSEPATEGGSYAEVEARAKV